jgi:hypothetical protein
VAERIRCSGVAEILGVRSPHIFKQNLGVCLERTPLFLFQIKHADLLDRSHLDELGLLVLGDQRDVRGGTDATIRSILLGEGEGDDLALGEKATEVLVGDGFHLV